MAYHDHNFVGWCCIVWRYIYGWAASLFHVLLLLICVFGGIGGAIYMYA